MQTLSLIDQKIAELEKKKKRLRIKAAETLFQKLESLLGEHFSPELILGIVSDHLSSTQDYDKWRQLGATFFRPSRPKKTLVPAATAWPSLPTAADKNAHSPAPSL